jgi:acetolactate synthase-1/2/3 large subunit
MPTGGQAFVDALLDNGVDFLSCVPGESFLPVLDALYERDVTSGTGPVRLVTARHESAAGFMAEAAGKLTGRPAACLVTRGPGAMHAAIAVHTAHQDGTPLVLVIGQIARDQRGREAFQEMDYRAVFASTAKFVVEIDDADRISELVARAVHIAKSGRPGPVVIALPEDMLYDETDAAAVVLPAVDVVPPQPAAVDRIADLLLGAERPLLVVGGSTWTAQAGRDISQFAEANGIPVATSFRFQDAVDNRGDAYVGYLGLAGSSTLYEHARRADVLVALGPRLDDPTTNSFDLIDTGRAGRHIAIVTDDPVEATQTTIPDTIVACAPSEMARLLAALPAAPTPERRRRTQLMREEHVEFVGFRLPELDLDVSEVMARVREALPDDAIVTNGAGNYTAWVQRFFEFRSHGTQIAPHNGAMAYGIPAGIAAATVRPGVPVVAFAGDGCFMMSGNELATAVQHELDLVVIILNNGMYGTIRMHQENHFPGRVIATQLRNPDFSMYASSFGAASWLVHRTEDFAVAFKEAQETGGVCVIELRTDPLQITADRRLDPEARW